ncbi:MAG: hypothetical protein ACHQ1D_01315 [Nitrososphaerales archaeon]
MYEIKEIRSVQEIYTMFPNGIADSRNWIFLSTGGVHGTDNTIDDAEYILRGEDLDEEPLPNGRTLITVLIVQPTACVLLWGEVQVNMDDLTYLRGLVRSTIINIHNSQGGNI